MYKTINIQRNANDYNELYCFVCQQFIPTGRRWSEHFSSAQHIKNLSQLNQDWNETFYTKYYTTLCNRKPISSFLFPENYHEWIEEKLKEKNEIKTTNVNNNNNNNSLSLDISLLKEELLSYQEQTQEATNNSIEKISNNIKLLNSNNETLNKNIVKNKTDTEQIISMLKHDDKNRLEICESYSKSAIKLISAYNEYFQKITNNQAKIIQKIETLEKSFSVISDNIEELQEDINNSTELNKDKQQQYEMKLLNIIETTIKKEMLNVISQQRKTLNVDISPITQIQQQTQQQTQQQSEQQKKYKLDPSGFFMIKDQN